MRNRKKKTKEPVKAAMLVSVLEGKLALLRAPFLDHQKGIKPQPYKKDSPKSWCEICGSSHGFPAAHIPFVGHAAVTDRLLDVDPLFSWAPMATDEMGLPFLDKNGGLWIKLKVLGLERIGYGDGGSAKYGNASTGGNALKEAIGDAIRNAAMRLGVALEDWHKGELHLPPDIGQEDLPSCFPKHTPPELTDESLEFPTGAHRLAWRYIREVIREVPGEDIELATTFETKDKRGVEQHNLQVDSDLVHMGLALGTARTYVSKDLNRVVMARIRMPNLAAEKGRDKGYIDRCGAEVTNAPRADWGIKTWEKILRMTQKGWVSAHERIEALATFNGKADALELDLSGRAHLLGNREEFVEEEDASQDQIVNAIALMVADEKAEADLEEATQ